MSLVGRQIGRYRILEALGQGGMSVVYKGLDTTLDREVAVKVLHAHLAGKLESRKRLEREAKAVARLKHPNILEVYDFAGVEGDDAYLVTEYIRGQTLREFINLEALQPPEVAMMVVHEIASALAHAHENGVIHRDLKPENVMLRDDGVLKLMDFGIAKILDRDEKMTMTGALVGSPAHMAPEIIEGEEAGAEADVFSLGTMLYLFATGKLPFTAPNTTATLKRILDCVYDDPRQVVPTVSDELAEIIGTCLQRQPSARYPTAARLRDALAALLQQVGLTRPGEELTRFFLDPRGYRAELTGRITTALLAQAEQFMRDKRPAKAMAALNQVLAHEPGNARAADLLAQMQRRKLAERRATQLRRGALLAGGGFIVLMSTLQGVRAATRAPDYVAPPFADGAAVVIANVAWPAPPQAAEAVDAGVEAVDAGPAPLTAPLPAHVRAVVERPVRTSPSPPPRLPDALLDVAVLVRPWGYLAVDGQPRSAEQLSRFNLKLSPGKHTFAVSCEQCDAKAPPRVIEVQPGQDVTLSAPLVPSLVSFAGFPEGALVRIGGEQRPAADTRERPFKVTAPPEGLREMRYTVRFEVTRDAVVIERGERLVEPGKPLFIERKGP